MWEWIKALNPFESENYHPWMREELEAVKAERDEWQARSKNVEAGCSDICQQKDALASELAALRQRQPVPVNVRWGGDTYDYDRLADKLSDGNQWTWNGMMVEQAFTEFAAHAVIDVPAGVPSLQAIHELYWREREGITQDLHVMSGTEANAYTAIRDAVLAGVAGDGSAANLNDPDVFRDCEQWMKEGPGINNIESFLDKACDANRRYNVQRLLYMIDALSDARRVATPAPTPEQVEALASDMRAAWAIQQDEIASDYDVSDFTVYARAAFAHFRGAQCQ